MQLRETLVGDALSLLRVGAEPLGALLTIRSIKGVCPLEATTAVDEASMRRQAELRAQIVRGARPITA